MKRVKRKERKRFSGHIKSTPKKKWLEHILNLHTKFQISSPMGIWGGEGISEKRIQKNEKIRQKTTFLVKSQNTKQAHLAPFNYQA